MVYEIEKDWMEIPREKHLLFIEQKLTIYYTKQILLESYTIWTAALWRPHNQENLSNLLSLDNIWEQENEGLHTFFQNRQTSIFDQNLCRFFCPLLASSIVDSCCGSFIRTLTNTNPSKYFLFLSAFSVGPQKGPMAIKQIHRARLKLEIHCMKLPMKGGREKKQSRRSEINRIKAKQLTGINRQQHRARFDRLFYIIKESKADISLSSPPKTFFTWKLPASM